MTMILLQIDGSGAAAIINDLELARYISDEQVLKNIQESVALKKTVVLCADNFEAALLYQRVLHRVPTIDEFLQEGKSELSDDDKDAFVVAVHTRLRILSVLEEALLQSVEDKLTVSLQRYGRL